MRNHEYYRCQGWCLTIHPRSGLYHIDDLNWTPDENGQSLLCPDCKEKQLEKNEELIIKN